MPTQKGVPRADAHPEYFPYRDDGCAISPSCLECPLLICRHDNPGWLHREAKAHRDSQVIQAWRKEGATVIELARCFAISERTVYRILVADTCPDISPGNP